MVVGSSVSNPALCGLGQLHSYRVDCLPLLFLSRMHAAQLFFFFYQVGFQNGYLQKAVLPISMLSVSAQSGVWIWVQLTRPRHC